MKCSLSGAGLTTLLVVVAAATPAGATIINLAPLGIASATSEAFGSVAGDANDGNTNGNFQCRFGLSQFGGRR